MPTVFLLHGLPGSGKTTLARRLVASSNAVLLSHDERMRARHGANPPLADFARWAKQIGDELWDETGRIIQAGRDVILDWGFWTRAARDEAREKAAALGADCVLLRVRCPDEMAFARTMARSSDPAAGALEINAEAWQEFRARFEPLGDDEVFREIDGLHGGSGSA